MPVSSLSPRLLVFAALALLGACTPSVGSRVDRNDPEGEVTITGDELEPMREFVLGTRRVVVGEFVRIEMSRQFFEQQMGYTRDPQIVARTPVQVLPDGTRLIVLKNLSAQTANLNPDLLPRVYFGDGGLEVRAYKELRIYMRTRVNKEQPLFLHVVAKNGTGDAQMWVSGRLQHQKPTIRLDSVLIWSEDDAEYVHKASAG